MEKEGIKSVKQSFARCFLNGKNLIDDFYDVFLKSSPELPAYFAKTDFSQQKLLLRQGINCMIMYAEGVYAGSFCMDEIKISHSRKNYNIPPSKYVFWKNSLLEVLQKNDPQWNDDLHKLWTFVIDTGIKFIADGY